MFDVHNKELIEMNIAYARNLMYMLLAGLYSVILLVSIARLFGPYDIVVTGFLMLVSALGYYVMYHKLSQFE